MPQPFALSTSARPDEQRHVQRQDDHRLGARLAQTRRSPVVNAPALTCRASPPARLHDRGPERRRLGVGEPVVGQAGRAFVERLDQRRAVVRAHEGHDPRRPLGDLVADLVEERPALLRSVDGGLVDAAGDAAGDQAHGEARRAEGQPDQSARHRTHGRVAADGVRHVVDIEVVPREGPADHDPVVAMALDEDDLAQPWRVVAPARERPRRRARRPRCDRR